MYTTLHNILHSPHMYITHNAACALSAYYTIIFCMHWGRHITTMCLWIAHYKKAQGTFFGTVYKNVCFKFVYTCIHFYSDQEMKKTKSKKKEVWLEPNEEKKINVSFYFLPSLM